MPTLGVIGGMGPLAGVDFVRRIYEAQQGERDQDFLHVLLDSDPSIPDRTDALLHDAPSPVPALVRSARRLRRAGAATLVMACNTASAYRREVQQVSGVRWIDWIDVVVDEISKSGISRVRLLCTDGTTQLRLYDEPLAAHGIETVYPHTHAAQTAIRYAKAGRHLAARSICDALMAVSGIPVLIACTDLSMLYPTRPHGVQVFDASQLVAEHVARKEHPTHAR